MWRWLRNTYRSADPLASAAPEVEAAVLDEAWAVVAGRAAADVYVVRGRPVPGWAWLNVLAHGSPSQLADLTRLAPPYQRLPPVGSWARAVRDIAAQLVRIDETELAAIQAALFVPAELELLAGRSLPGGPSQLDRAVHRYLAGSGPR